MASDSPVVRADSQVERMAPTTLAGSYLAGRFAAGQRDAASAARYFRGALQRDPDNPILLERSLLLSLVSGHMNAALDLAAQTIAREPSHRVARLALAADALRADRFADAAQHLGESSNGPLAQLTNALLLAWAQAGGGDLAGAMSTIDMLHGPEWQEIFRPYYHSALIAEIAGDAELAEAHYRRAYEADPRALRIVQAWVRQLAKAGEADEALGVLDEFGQVLPDHPLLRDMRADIEAGRTPQPLASNPQDGAAEVLYGIGAALGAESAEEFSATYLQLALHLAPEHPLALLALADYFEKVSDPGRAIELYERIPEASPLRRNADTQRALNLNDLDRFDDARALLEDNIAADPDNRDAVIALGNLLRGKEQFEEAAGIYSQAIATIETPERRHWTLYYFRGICYERSGQWPLAEKDFKQALALEPDQPYVLNYLGYSWVDQNVRLEEAMDMIVRAVEQRPDDGYIVDSLGWAYYRLGRYEEAVRELERAVELRAEDPIINDHLGDAYWRVGRRIEARFQWSHSRDLGPEPDLLEQIVDKLENGLPELTETPGAAAELPKDVD